MRRETRACALEAATRAAGMVFLGVSADERVAGGMARAMGVVGAIVGVRILNDAVEGGDASGARRARTVVRCVRWYAFGCAAWFAACVAFGGGAMGAWAGTASAACATVAVSLDGGEEEDEARASVERVLLDGCPRTAREASARASVLGACAGAWAGATPIPLDWNRTWQRWPVSVVRGLAFGHVLGIAVALLYVWLADVMGLDPRDGASRRKRR
jgi:hypothetical protein